MAMGGGVLGETLLDDFEELNGTNNE